MYGEVIWSCTDISTRRIGALCRQNVEFFNVKFCCTCSKTVDSKGLIHIFVSFCHVSGTVPLNPYCSCNAGEDEGHIFHLKWEEKHLYSEIKTIATCAMCEKIVSGSKE